MIYNHQKIESKWQQIWQEKNLYKTEDDFKREKYYVLDMFPYPSGEGLHVGHPKGYIATDIIARQKMMENKNILHPMGWDAFGLPAENYALANKVHPAEAVEKNIIRFKEQLAKLGLTYDWSREIKTTDPAYYKWTQWIFIQLFKKGLAYESFEPINWCPSCKTGLANEDLEDGKCERCGTVVEKKPLRQWVLKITNYAERLLDDLKKLDWPESIKESQRNWIGKSEGAEISFSLTDAAEKITVFTTRVDTLFGVTYIVLSPEHELIKRLKNKITNFSEVNKYIESAVKKTDIDRAALDKEKTGVEIKGLKAINPATKEEIPLWVADYVLADYGTGAVMAVPAHDERDFLFAKKFNLPIKQVIAPYFSEKNYGAKDAVRSDKTTSKRKTVYALVYNQATDSYLGLDWTKYNWHSGVIGGVEEGETYEQAARREILEETGYKNLKFIKELGGEQHNYFFAAHKDINRYGFGQGLLFELVNETKIKVEAEHIKNHQAVWIKSSEMDNWLNLPSFIYMWQALKNNLECLTDDGVVIQSGKFSGLESSIARTKMTKAFGKKVVRYKLRDWVFSRQRYWGEPIPIVHCSQCGVVLVKEKDLPVTLPDVKHYEPTGTGESPLANITNWVNTKCPNCGGEAKRETNTMPQWAGSSWYYLRYLDPKNSKELVNKKIEKYWSPVDMYVGGAEHATRHLIYARFWHKFLYDIKVVNYDEPFKRYSNLGLILGADGRKMSKRWKNVINPDDMVAKYGADAFRIYEMFLSPFTQSASFLESGVAAAKSFIKRVIALQAKINKQAVLDNKTKTLLHQTIKKVGEDINDFKFNTAVSSLMILTKAFNDLSAIDHKSYEILLQLLAPIAPHISEELWQALGHKESIFKSSWPKYSAKFLVGETVVMAIQVNGKLRDTCEITTDITDEEIKKQVLARPTIQKWIDGKTIKKVIVVKGRVVNIVI